VNAAPAAGVATDDPVVLCDQGNVLQEQGQFRDAIACYSKALEIRPDYLAALANRSNAWRALGDTDTALADLQSAMQIREFPEGFNNRGNILRDQGRLLAALADFDDAIALRPQFMLAYCNRGKVLLDLNRCAAGLHNFAAALRLAPDFGEALFGHATALLRLGRDLELAAAQFARAAESGIDRAETFVGQAAAYAGLGRHIDAAACLRRALELNPERDFALGSLLYSNLSAIDWTDFAQRKIELGERLARGQAAAQPHTLLYIIDDPQLQLACARLAAAALRKLPLAAPVAGVRQPDAPIRVAYLSADLRDHAVSHLLIGTLLRHDRSAFEIIGVSLRRGAESAFDARVHAAFDHWIDATELTDEDIAARLRELHTDIVVDLMGYTEGARPGILIQRPAPVQVGYLGYAGTTANPAVDYLIADHTVIPPGEEGGYTEKVVRLPQCFLPNDDQRAIATGLSRREAGLPPSGFVFCAAAHPAKINPALFEVWMRLLREVPESVLWLRALSPAALENLRREPRARGVSAERLVMMLPAPEMPVYLGKLSHADLFLDTTPYSAHSTACDALWAGVPVLAIMGHSFASRVAASALTAAGLPELITRSLPEYAARALEIARDATQLRTLRATLNANRSSAPLFDTEGYTRNLETAFRNMVARVGRGDA
jgi:protein O-GlcNAc transferase